jgi:hypothetical protein
MTLNETTNTYFQRKNITSVLPTAGKKSPRHLEGYLESLAHIKILI